MDRGNIRNDVDPRILAELIISLAMRSMEKMIIGVNESEVRRTWSESLALILGIKKELIPQASGTEGPSQDRLRST
jgi:hypothetical protein